MSNETMLMIIIAAVIIAFGIFMGVKGKPSMVRDRFSKGVSPENERKFMMTIGGGICIIGLDMLLLNVLSVARPISHQQTLLVLGIGIVLFVAVILLGQFKFRR